MNGDLVKSVLKEITETLMDIYKRTCTFLTRHEFIFSFGEDSLSDFCLTDARSQLPNAPKFLHFLEASVAVTFQSQQLNAYDSTLNKHVQEKKNRNFYLPFNSSIDFFFLFPFFLLVQDNEKALRAVHAC